MKKTGKAILIATILLLFGGNTSRCIAEQPSIEEREREYKLLLHLPGEGWKINEDEEKKALTPALSIRTMDKKLNRPIEPIVYHSYIKDGQEVSVSINFPRPANALASAIENAYVTPPSAIKIKGYQGEYKEFTHLDSSPAGHQLAIYIGDDTIVSFTSNTLSKEQLIQYANTMDYDKVLQFQPNAKVWAAAHKANAPHRKTFEEEAAQCKTSKLTSAKYLEMLHTLFLHGDLTDIPFLEETLQTKFASNDNPQGNRNPNIKNYKTDTVMGAPIYVYLTSGFHDRVNSTNQEPERVAQGRLTFIDLYHDYTHSHDCGYLTKPQLDYTFGGVFTVENHHKWGEAGQMDAMRDLEKIGKSGTDMGVSYSFIDKDQTVLSVDLYQSDLNSMVH